ncbi:dicer-like protein 1 [Rhizoctonia solani AG-1 IA]|uniref:Dicer-like protein 1 n=1 Tax=Thanatephorus cucumeris (strain AG1-IA) TaxID=983506 RepID=L8WV88_THACA|nr:dicer-like protein 1 [Rhizoctonia solani AG-1 IA]
MTRERNSQREIGCRTGGSSTFSAFEHGAGFNGPLGSPLGRIGIGHTFQGIGSRQFDFQLSEATRYSALPRTMSHLNRAAPGSGGLPLTSGSSLSPGGLKPPRLGGLAPGVSTAILSSNTYEEDARRVYDGLDSSAKPKASLYTPSTSGSSFNHVWFKELRQGLAITPASYALLALDRGLIKLSRLSHLIVDDAHLVALEDLSSPLSTILLDHYGKLPTAGRPRVLGLTHYPLELEANFGYSALRMEQLLDARILGNLDAKRVEVAHDANRLEVSVLEYESRKGALPVLPPGFHPAFEAATLELGGWCVPLFSLFNPDSDSEGLIMDKRTITIPLLEGISLDQTSKLNEILKYLNAASMSSHFRCIIIEDFKNGLINTLICTESILSSIDGDVCSHVICGASLTFLAERGNREHYQVARDILKMDNSIYNWVLNMNVDGAPSPPKPLANCRRFNQYSIIIGPSRESSRESPYIQDPIIGSRIYIQESEEVFYRFLANRAEEDAALIPVKVFSYERVSVENTDLKDHWCCTIRTNSCDPPLEIHGEPSLCKALARSSACFRACFTLFNLGLLPSSFFPSRPLHTWKHGILQPPKNRVAIDTYYPPVLPLFWHNCLLAAPSKLFYPYLIQFSMGSQTGLYPSMILLIRIPLGDIKEFSVFPNQTELKVSLSQCAPLSLITEQVELAFRYTLNLWRILGNKQYDSPSGELAYFVLPVKFGPNFEPTRIARTTSIEPCISWQEVNDLVSFRVRPLKCNNVDEMWLDLMNGVIQDRSNEFTRRFENAKLRKDLNPLSLIMQDKPGEPQISLLDYYRTHRHEFEGIQNLQQPLIEATLLPGLANQLNPQEPTVQKTTNYLVPEICYVSSIPAPTFRTASLLPSVIWHIENVLIAKEVNLTFFQGQIQDELVAHALCSRMAHRTFSYERLEFLGRHHIVPHMFDSMRLIYAGDTFIKYAASAYLYGVEPTAPSGVLHSKRQKMVNNRSLWLGAQALGLPPCIQSDVFRPKQWVIPNVLISKKSPIHGENPGFTGQAQLLNSRQYSRQIPPKTIADVVEAMIGAALLSGGEELAFSVAKTLGFDTLKTCDWLDVISYAPNKSMTMKESDHKGETLDGLIKIIGVSLDNPELLLQAMVRIFLSIIKLEVQLRTVQQHASMARSSESYERLEFLGDAVLDMLVVQSFFSDEEEWSPHSMTLIKSSMVSNRALAIICIESGLHQYLMHDINSLAQSIVTFIDEVQKCKQIARTDAQRLKYWSKLVAPKALGDVVESLLGAIYISSGFSITRVKTVYDRVLKPFYDRYIDKKAMLTHPMSRLMKRLESIGCRSFGVAKAETQLPNGGTGFKCEVKIHGQIIAQAASEKAQQAIKDATERALNLLDAQPDRVLANCTCRAGPQGKKRKRVSMEDAEEGEIVEALPGDDADHPIDVDMFDF